MKKYLSVLLAIMMFMSSFAVTTNAANQATCNHVTSEDPAYLTIVNPTCTEGGYTLYHCVKGCGYKVKGNIKEALGHKFGEEEYDVLDAEAGTYTKVQKCTRNGCDEKLHELQNGNKVVYYLVNFVNDKFTADEDGYLKEEIDYALVANPEKYVEKELYSTYVKAGEEAFYEAEEPIRVKTKEFGAYSFIGWSKEKKDAKRNANLSLADCEELTNISASTVYYPVFEGRTDVAYDVTFYNTVENNSIEQLTNTQPVIHGGSPKYHNTATGEQYDDPKRADDLTNRYEFSGWATQRGEYSTLSTKDMLETPVYGNLNYYATYDAIPLNYTIEFRTEDGSDLLTYTVNEGEDNAETFTAVLENQHFGTNLLTENEAMAYINSEFCVPEKADDNTYFYTWTGKWLVLTESGSASVVVDLKDFSVDKKFIRYLTDEDGNKVFIGDTDEQVKVIRLVPQYERRLKVYAVDVEMIIPTSEDDAYYLGGAEISIVDKDGQAVANGFTNEYGKKRFYLNYNAPFTVTVATADGKYLGTSTITRLQKSLEGEDIEAQINKCPVQMGINPEYETHCSCIHHNSLLQPILVRVYNILYTFFNYKYVCCYDMYSTIGPLLDYAAD